jgi:protein-disulfide isomerase
MRISAKLFPSLLLSFAWMLPTHCKAQTQRKEDGTLSIQFARRIEVMFRSRVDLPPTAEVQVGPRTPSELPGYDQISVTYSVQGQTSQPTQFLISRDGKTVAQFNKFDISQDPRTLVPEANRPARGGPETAPVRIVVFDDLECPYCARLNAAIFPAILDRYKDQVRIIYRDYPSEGHPWAMHAAIDTSCLGQQSAPAYWTAVDTIHRQAGDLGGQEHSLAKANTDLDTLVRGAGQQQKVDLPALNACIEKQDATAIKQSELEGQTLGVVRTPTLFINGAKIEGAVPLDFLFKMIDNALLAQGQTPPPPYSAPSPSAPALH